MRSLHPRIRIVWVLQAVLSAAILAAVVGAVGVFALDLGIWLPVAAFAGLFVLFGAHGLLRYRVWRYEVREDALYLERGVFTRVKTVVPFVRIQHVDSRRSPLERATGLASTVVYTAGSRGADVTVPGLTPEGADDLQRRLKALAIDAEGDDAV
ncbi:PH domain-containing protein [Halalkalicoccus sp. NIPERK01]|uniref:PH domain-containing protein n=1 Tax=Halalkalicoccus sp. NIPERK01 TaxID=3053469 RepID=UPI00256EE208|nr:PH domain-containing protein [Halalkalicoccus sp. NIPERK01]MDL5360711.1 PH domain-containing protein [Halalkalicoccus sp. NIPERK01]